MVADRSRLVSLTLPAVREADRAASSRSGTSRAPPSKMLSVTVRDLSQARCAMSTLDILGEFISTPERSARRTRVLYEDLIRRDRPPGTADRMRNISVKLTSIGPADRPARSASTTDAFGSMRTCRSAGPATSFASTWKIRRAPNATLEIYRRRCDDEFAGRRSASCCSPA